MNTVLVSIIIPTFNRANEIQTAIKSVMTQTYSNWECIIVDDGSTDSTFSILDAFSSQDPRIKFIKRNRLPKGAPTCRNIGLAISKGDYILFLDSDDFLLPHCLEQRVNKVIEFPDNDFLVFPMGELIDHVVKKREIPRYNDYLIPFLSAVLPWQITSPIWKRKFLKSLNGFSEGYPRFNDPELMIRALLVDNVSFKVLYNFECDSVFIPSSKNEIVFTDTVFKSLMLFIPDISNYLELKDKFDQKKHLACYLYLWFKYIYVPSNRRDLQPSMQLIIMFKRKGVISRIKAMSLLGRLLIFSLSKLILKKPINKITDKSLYV